MEDELFCANPACVLHVTPADAHVAGRGDWATLSSGLTFARVLVGDHFYCHACADNPDVAPRTDGPSA